MGMKMALLKENLPRISGGRSPGRNSTTWRTRLRTPLIAKGIRKGDKVIHLMMNCLEWLPAYFGILRTGAWAVPLNFRFTADDIRYCADIAEARAIVFGEEFIERVDKIKKDLNGMKDFIYSGPKEMKPKPTPRTWTMFVKGASTAEPKTPISLSGRSGTLFHFRHHRTAQAHSPHPQKP